MKKLLGVLASALLAGLAFAGTNGSQADDNSVIAKQLPSYPLDTCVVSGEPLTSMGEPLNAVHEGRLVRLCCKGCLKGLKKDPAAALAKIDEAVVKAQLASYPLDTCVVSGKPLAGEPVNQVHGTRLVRFCCNDCVKAFEKDSDGYMAKVDAALIAAQIPTYPTDQCLISEEPLNEMGEPLDMLYGTRLVRFCCKGCVKEFKKDPQALLSKLDALAMKKG